LTPLGSPVGGRRPTAAARRRKNLTYLASFIVGTFLLGLLPPLRFLLIFNLIADVMLIAYLGLAVYMTVWPPERERFVETADPALAPQRVAEGGY
jgi:hypothetical protein